MKKWRNVDIFIRYHWEIFPENSTIVCRQYHLPGWGGFFMLAVHLSVANLWSIVDRSKNFPPSKIWFPGLSKQHKSWVLIHLNDDSLYTFTCWSPCLLCLLILMMIILMVSMIKCRSNLIVYWLGDRNLRI